MRKKSKQYVAHETLAVVITGLFTLAIIIALSATFSSCSTTQQVGYGHKVAPMVNYDVKKIKLQANSNVIPK